MHFDQLIYDFVEIEEKGFLGVVSAPEQVGDWSKNTSRL